MKRSAMRLIFILCMVSAVAFQMRGMEHFEKEGSSVNAETRLLVSGAPASRWQRLCNLFCCEKSPSFADIELQRTESCRRGKTCLVFGSSGLLMSGSLIALHHFIRSGAWPYPLISFGAGVVMFLWGSARVAFSHDCCA